MREIEKNYQEKLAEYEKYRGSIGYENARREFEQARADGVEAARKEYGPRLRAIITDMEKVYASKPMRAPTTEQLNLLQALKLRTSISRDELRRAAITLGDCPAALEGLREIGKNLGVPTGIPQENDTVSENLETLNKRTAQMLSLNKVDDRRKHANGLLSDNLDLFQIDTDPANEVECMRIMALATDPAGFSAAVND